MAAELKFPTNKSLEKLITKLGNAESRYQHSKGDYDLFMQLAKVYFDNKQKIGKMNNNSFYVFFQYLWCVFAGNKNVALIKKKELLEARNPFFGYYMLFDSVHQDNEDKQSSEFCQYLVEHLDGSFYKLYNLYADKTGDVKYYKLSADYGNLYASYKTASGYEHQATLLLDDIEAEQNYFVGDNDDEYIERLTIDMNECINIANKYYNMAINHKDRKSDENCKYYENSVIQLYINTKNERIRDNYLTEIASRNYSAFKLLAAHYLENGLIIDFAHLYCTSVDFEPKIEYNEVRHKNDLIRYFSHIIDCKKLMGIPVIQKEESKNKDTNIALAYYYYHEGSYEKSLEYYILIINELEDGIDNEDLHNLIWLKYEMMTILNKYYNLYSFVNGAYTLLNTTLCKDLIHIIYSYFGN